MEALLFGFIQNSNRNGPSSVLTSTTFQTVLTKKNMAVGYDGLRGFLSSNREFSLPAQVATAAAKGQGFNKVRVEKYFDPQDGHWS